MAFFENNDVQGVQLTIIMLQKMRKIYPLQLDIIPLVLIFLAIYFTAANHASLPERIPTHFNSQGFPDEWSSKNDLIIYPAMDFFIYVLFTGISVAMAVVKDPKRLINLPARIKESLTAAQADDLRVVLVRCLLALKIVIMGMMTYLLFGNIEVALGHSASLGHWPFVFVALMLLVVGYMLYRTFKIVLQRG
jgi:uncharacterized membrane protein